MYHFLFPPSTRIAPWNCGRAACKLCVAYAADHAAWCANPEAPVPTCTPRLHTSVAGGPDGLPAELLSWARPDDTVDRRAYRIRVAEAVAAVLSAALRDGRVPASVAEVVITPIFKPAKAGQVVARDDPAAYRGISVCNLTAKLLGVLITARLSHWSAFHGLISPAQAGFQSGRAAEWHVLVLDQAVKARRRAGADTYVAFFDLEKAYDRVHGSAMRAVLTRMGVPPRLVALVAEWDAVRRARIRVNGELSEPFGVDAGRPQGAPTSPIEFNLFIESLLRGIARRFPGVQVLRIRVDALAYADDLATPAESRAQLQSIVAFVEEWCHKWNMRLNTGPGKSEAIRFAEGQTDAQAAAHPPLTLADGRLISFVPEYRYLGYVVRHDLGTGAMSTKLQGKLLDTYHRYFTRNAVVRGASALLQLQLYRTCVIGAVNYARSVGMLSAIVRRKIDSTINEAARHILHLPSGTATALVLTASRLLTAVGVGARERERLRLQLVHTPWRDGIAPRLLAELEAEPRTRASTSGPAANWAHVAAVARRREARLGATLPAAASYVDVARVASVYARQLSYLTLQRAVRRAAPSTPAVITLPPASHGSLQHIAALRFGFPATAATLGQRHATTPLSVGGPGCLGSPLALVERGRFPALTSALLGDEALHRWPFVDAPPGARRPVPYAQRFDSHPCTLCGAAVETLYHLLCECPHAEMRRFRAIFAASLPALVLGLWLHGIQILQELRWVGLATTAAQDAALVAFTSRSPDLSTPDACFVAYWLLLGTPWPASVVDPALHPWPPRWERSSMRSPCGHASSAPWRAGGCRGARPSWWASRHTGVGHGRRAPHLLMTLGCSLHFLSLHLAATPPTAPWTRVTVTVAARATSPAPPHLTPRSPPWQESQYPSPNRVRTQGRHMPHYTHPWTQRPHPIRPACTPSRLCASEGVGSNAIRLEIALLLSRVRNRFAIALGRRGAQRRMYTAAIAPLIIVIDHRSSRRYNAVRGRRLAALRALLELAHACTRCHTCIAASGSAHRLTPTRIAASTRVLLPAPSPGPSSTPAARGCANEL